MLALVVVVLSAAPVRPAGLEAKDPKLAAAGQVALDALPWSGEAKGALGLTASVDGAKVVVVAKDPARPKVFGQGEAKLQKVKPQFADRALVAALKQAIPKALEDLEARALEAKGQGVRRLRFALQLNGLESKARAHVKESLLPCLKQRLELVGPVTQAEELSGFWEEQVEYAPFPGEPRESLGWHAEQVRESIVGGPKASCTTFGTPLQGYSTNVTVDALNQGVLVTFRR